MHTLNSYTCTKTHTHTHTHTHRYINSYTQASTHNRPAKAQDVTECNEYDMNSRHYKCTRLKWGGWGQKLCKKTPQAFTQRCVTALELSFVHTLLQHCSGATNLTISNQN